MQSIISRDQLRRINIVGTSGSGKTTVARQLAKILGHPLIEMDRLYWGADWQPVDDDQFFENLERQTNGEQWIVDGNYSRAELIKWRNVTAIIWLDYSYMRTVSQALRRAVSRSVSQQEIWPDTGNRESLRRTFFSKNSILLWTLQTHFPVRRKFTSLMNDPLMQHVAFVRLKNPQQSRAFLNTVQTNFSSNNVRGQLNQFRA